MTIVNPIGASPDRISTFSWEQIPWDKAEKLIQRLQLRIAKAIREKKIGKAKALQRLLTSSFYGKCLAVKRVVQSKGGKTPGVDGVTWQTSSKKIQAVCSLKRRGVPPATVEANLYPKERWAATPTFYTHSLRSGSTSFVETSFRTNCRTMG